MLLAHAVADHESVTELLRLGVLLPLALVGCVAALARRLGARRSATVVALVTAATAPVVAIDARCAQPVWSDGPTVGIAAGAIIAAVPGTAILGPCSAMAATVGDGSLAALVLRSGGVASFAFVGRVVALW